LLCSFNGQSNQDIAFEKQTKNNPPQNLSGTTAGSGYQLAFIKGINEYCAWFTDA